MNAFGKSRRKNKQPHPLVESPAAAKLRLQKLMASHLHTVSLLAEHDLIGRTLRLFQTLKNVVCCTLMILTVPTSMVLHPAVRPEITEMIFRETQGLQKSLLCMRRWNKLYYPTSGRAAQDREQPLTDDATLEVTTKPTLLRIGKCPLEVDFILTTSAHRFPRYDLVKAKLRFRSSRQVHW